MSKHNDLHLYYFDSCRYCQTVLQWLSEHNLDIPKTNTMEDMEAFNHLYTTTGRAQVPCLFIDGNPMHESDDIVEWLDKKNQNSELEHYKRTA